MIKLFLACIIMLATFALAQLATAQGCQSAPCLPNPIPCAHCIGTWTDDQPEGDIVVYKVFSEPNPTSPGEHTVSGTATKVNVWGLEGCTFTYDISGTIEQTEGSATTELHWTMTDHGQICYENGEPIVWSTTYTFEGTMENNSCDNASGTWTNAVGGGSGNLYMTKPADIPNGSPTETSTSVAWWGNNPTIVQFHGTIHGTVDDPRTEQHEELTAGFAGRQVFEQGNNDPTDTCFADWIPIYGQNPERYRFHVTGGYWWVGYYSFLFYNTFTSTYDYDYVGMPWDLIDAYRQYYRTPCYASAGQNMRIYTEDATGSEVYKNDNLLEISLPDDFRVEVARDGVSEWRYWGIQTDTVLPPARQGIPYTTFLGAAMEATPYTWSLASGSLPAGLAPPSCSNPPSCSTAVISGTPQAAGSYTFTVRVADSSGFWATRFFILIVLSPIVPGQLVSE